MPFGKMPVMLLRLFVCFAIIVLSRPAAASNEQAREPRRGFVSRTLDRFRPSKKSTGQSKNVAISLTIAPQPVKLSETRELQISLILKNNSKNAVRLEFPTTQRIEAVIREKMGKIITQWSEDQTFSNETSYLVINPRERLEYSVSLPTRDMVAGRDYSVEVFLPNYENLRARRFVTPEK